MDVSCGPQEQKLVHLY